MAYTSSSSTFTIATQPTHPTSTPLTLTLLFKYAAFKFRICSLMDKGKRIKISEYNN